MDYQKLKAHPEDKGNKMHLDPIKASGGKICDKHLSADGFL